MTHGVISNTANLTYQDESGAINESLADIFGALSEMHSHGATSPAEWEMGEDMKIFTLQIKPVMVVLVH